MKKLIIFIIVLSIILLIIGVLIIIKMNKKGKTRSNTPSSSTSPTPSPTPFTPTFPPSPSQELYNIKYWPSMIDYENTIIQYPELSTDLSLNFLNKPIDNTKISMAIGGGGPRSVAAQIGYTKALKNILKNYTPYTVEQYVSTSSGGSWFYGPYTFIKTQTNYSDDILLGESILINSIYKNNKLYLTDNILSTLNNNDKFLGKTCTYSLVPLNLIEQIIECFIKGDTDGYSRLWDNAIVKMLLEPYGIEDTKIQLPICLNQKHYEDIIKRNPSLQNQKFLYANDNFSFWLCNSTFALQTNTLHFPYTNIAINPLYSGIPSCIFDDVKNNGNDVNTGCYFTEGFAGGVMLAPSDKIDRNTDKTISNSKVLNLNKNKNIRFRTLSNLISNSSFVMGSLILDTQSLFPKYLEKFVKYFTSQESIKRRLLALLPKYNIWIQDQNNTNLQDINNYQKDNHKNTEINNTVLNDAIAGLLDAGFADNTGIIALLQRKAQKIISFVFPSNSMEDTQCEQVLEGLFGAPIDPGCEYSDFTEGIRQVFENSIYFGFGQNPEQRYIKDSNNNYIKDNKGNPQYCIQYQLYDTKFNKGGPCYAYLENISTKENKIFGVPSYTVKKLLIISLQYSSKFVDQITDTNLQADIRLGRDSSPKKPPPYGIKYETVIASKNEGNYKHFPNYDLKFENPGIGALNYTYKQTNLLNIYTEWSLYQDDLRNKIIDIYQD